MAMTVMAQMQQGYVKTLGRPDKPGQPLSGVSVRVKGGHNAVLSNDKGTFAMPMAGMKAGDAYQLQQVHKQGFELNDPGVLGRPYAFSDRVPLTVTMVSSQQLQADKQRIENKAYEVAERNYKKLMAQLEQQKSASAITAEQYREQLHNLQDKFEKYQSLIDGLADHYAHVDYDGLNEKEQQVNLLIEQGELERADKLLRKLFDPTDVLKRNQEAMTRIDQRQSQAERLLAQANEDMARILKQQEKDAEYLYQLYTIALSRYDNDKARFYIETRAELDTTNIAWQNDAGRFISEYLADYPKALSYFQCVLRQCRSQSIEEADAYFDIGKVLQSQRKLQESLDSHSKALSIMKGLGSEDVNTSMSNSEIGMAFKISRSYTAIGSVYNDMNKYKEALKYYQKSLGIIEKIHDHSIENEYCLSEKDTREYIEYNNVALAYYNLGDYENALENWLDAWRELEDTPGVELATILLNMGAAYRNNGEYDRALKYEFEAKDMLEKVLSANHPDIANAYNEIGVIYFAQKLYDDAEQCFEKALHIYENVFGEQNSSIALTYMNLGETNRKRADYEKALDFQTKAIDIYENVSDTDSLNLASAYNNKASVLDDMKNYAEAMKWYIKAKTIREGLLGVNHPATARSYNDIGICYHHQKNYKEAIAYLHKAKDIWSQSEYGDVSNYVTCNGNLGEVYISMGDYTNGKEYMKKYLFGTISIYGKENTKVAIISNKISLCYMKLNEYEKARKYEMDALAIHEKLLDENHPDLAVSYNNMGSICKALGEYSKAREYYYRALSIFQRAVGPDDESTKFVENKISELNQVEKGQ